MECLTTVIYHLDCFYCFIIQFSLFILCNIWYNICNNNLEGGTAVYQVEWTDEFREVVTSGWTNDRNFIKGMYLHMKSKNALGLKIVEKVEVTDEWADILSENPTP